MKLKRQFLSLLVTLTILMSVTAPFAYANDAAPDKWAVNELVDAQALSFPIKELMPQIKGGINSEQLSLIGSALSKKLEIIGKAESPVLVAQKDAITRKDVLDYIYSVAFSYSYSPSLEKGSDVVSFCKQAGVLKGSDTGDLMLSNPCTAQEALIFASRITDYVYNATGNSSKGLLWKATNGDTTLYLLGTIHVDKGNVYPFSSRLKSVISSCNEAIFEIDFNDSQGIKYYSDNTKYTDGSFLKDHISSELYSEIKKIYAKFGVSEEVFNVYKPWALASEITNLALYSKDGSVQNTSAPIIIDSYVYSKALTQGSKISEVEGWKFQTDLFNSISDKAQNDYLKSAVVSYQQSLSGTSEDNQQIDLWLKAWKSGDLNAFNALYNKDKDIADGDEFTRTLFVERDKHMSQYAMDKLNAKDGKTSVLVVGLGHMVGKDGIINVLLNNGFKVELCS